jgi:aspartyl-tRNA(Asn)/glutamyl-tRNA(Gln) amidotransferase subunit B
MRSKEDAPDYRFMPDPDLPVVIVDDERLARARAALPELPGARRRRYIARGISSAQAAVIVDDADTAAYFDAAVAASSPAIARSVANWLLNELIGLQDGLARATPAQLARLVTLVEDGAIAGKSGKEVLRALEAGGAVDAVDAVVDARGLRLQQGTDADAAILAVVKDVLAKNPAQVAQVKSGKDKIKGFLVGQCLKQLAGAADPKKVQDLVDQELALL